MTEAIDVMDDVPATRAVAQRKREMTRLAAAGGAALL